MVKRTQPWLVCLMAIALLVAAVIAAGSGSFDRSLSPQQRFAQAVEAAATQDWPTVAEHERALRGLPEFEYQRMLLAGLLQIGNGRLQGGLQLLARCAENEQTQLLAVLTAGIVQYELGNFDESVRLLRQCTVWDPQHEDAHRYLAAAYYDIGAMDDALRVLESLVQIAPHDYRGYRFRGVILQDYEHYEDAESQFREALARSETDSAPATDITLSLAECLLKLRRYDQSLRLLQQVETSAASLSDDRRIDLYAAQAEAGLAMRRFDDAADAIESAPDGATSSPSLALVAARLAEERHDPGRGIEILRAAIARHPGAPMLHARLGDLLALTQRTDESAEARSRADQLQSALTEFAELHQQAIERPDDSQLRLKLAAVAEQLHRMELAEMWLKAAIGLAPESAEAQEALRAFQSRRRQEAAGL